MKFYQLVVVIPIGPRCRPDFISDTIDSIAFYTRASYRLVLADDSQQGTGQLLKQKYKDIDVMETGRSMGKLCGLYVTLSLAFRYVLSRYHFDALLRMDTDALIIGPAPEKEAIGLFRQYPGIGMAGQYPFDYEGNPWDISWPRTQLVKYTGSYKFFKRPLTHFLLWRHHRKARRNGYRTGESVFGGACFFSERCLRLLLKQGLLPNRLLKNVNLEEDHLFSLLVRSAGMELGDLFSGGNSVACAWLGLPASPAELHAGRRKIIHSTRYWKDLTEDGIRNFFREKRQPVVAAFEAD